MSGFSPSARMRSGLDPARIVAAGHQWQGILARWGLAAKGLLYTALGILAIDIARGGAPSGSATSENAVQLVASQPFGQLLLVVLTAGLFALALWQLLMAIKGDPVEGSEASDRAVYVLKAVVYGATAMTALAMLTGNAMPASGTASGSEGRATAEIMSWPGGPFIVALIGLGVLGAGVYHLFYNAWQGHFMERLAEFRMSYSLREHVERAGRTGYAARGIVFAIVGVFLMVAAIQHDPQEAIGVSGAVQKLAEQSWGTVVLWMVAVGFFLYGCFCFAEAKYRRLA